MPFAAARPAEPAHALLRPDQRRVAQRFRAASQDQIGNAFADVAIPGVDRLHAGAAIDLHREGDHGFAHAEPQRGDARGFISSAITLTQPRITWSNAVGAKGCRAKSGRPHCTARSTGC